MRDHPGIALVSCGKAKLDHAAPAEELYTGNLFRAAFEYCKARYWPMVYIVSARYGLLPPGQVVDPYDLTLTDLPNDSRIRWGRRVISDLTFPYILPGNIER